jgi:glutamate/aspartate transport system substrate-binding protein
LRHLPTALAAALCALTATSAAAGPVLDGIREKGRIVIAHRESSVPFSYVDGGKPVGYAVDLCKKIADAVRTRLGLRTLAVEYLKVTPSDRMPAIVERRADLECGSTTNNAERRQKVAFTVPHYVAGARYLVRADSEIGDLQGFQGKKLVSTTGTTPLKAIAAANKERLLGITVLEAPDHARAVEMVEKGEADGFAMDDVLLYGLRAGRQDPNKLKVVGKLLTVEALSIMLSRDDAEFKQIVDDEMKRLVVSREANALYERWFTAPIPPKNTPLNIPMNYLLKDLWKYPTDWGPG